MNFWLHNFRVVCLEDPNVIVTGDFNINVLRREIKWFLAFLDAEFSLPLLSDVKQSTIRNTSLDILVTALLPIQTQSTMFTTFRMVSKSSSPNLYSNLLCCYRIH